MTRAAESRPDGTQTRWLLVDPYWRRTGSVTHVHVRAGQEISSGDPLLDIGGVPLVSPAAGVLARVDVAPGDEVGGGHVVAQIDVAVRGGVHHVLGMFDEPGMGYSLWARNDDAYDEFTSYVSPADLDLSPGLSAQLERLEYLTHVGWDRRVVDDDDHADDPRDAFRLLTEEELRELQELDVPALVQRLRDELGRSFSVVLLDVPVEATREGVRYRSVGALTLAREPSRPGSPP